MVKQYFTTYKNVIKLFLPELNIEKLLKYKITKSEKSSQSLIIFPDLRTAYNNIDNNIKNNIFYSWKTTISKLKLFWWIKKWKIKELYCTHSQIFQDRNNLKNITIYYPHRWYYKNQKDPRYNTKEIVKKLAEIHWAKLNMINDLSI